MTAKRFLPFYLSTFLLVLFSGCFGSKLASSEGGEVTGTGGRSFNEWHDAHQAWSPEDGYGNPG